jgi:hypothetical protein
MVFEHAQDHASQWATSARGSKQLERENVELRRANEILRVASA